MDRGRVIDQETSARIRAFEQARGGSEQLRWPVWVALALGALMVCAGVLLFVSAHWDALSPFSRFALVIAPDRSAAPYGDFVPVAPEPHSGPGARSAPGGLTVPDKGLPRPIRLGVKKAGVLTPLDLD